MILIILAKTIEQHRISGVIFSMLASSMVDREFEPRSDQTKDYEISVRYFSPQLAILRRKSKDWLARYQDDVYEWGQHVFRRTVVSMT